MNKHGGYFGNKETNIIDFSVNINPLGVPSSLINKLEKELSNLITYPEIDGKTAKEILGKYLNKKTEQIIFGNGATELIYLFARAIKAPKTLILQPTFTEYERAFKLSGSNIYHFYTYEENNFYINMDELLKSIKEINPKVVVLCNPNNPTGVFFEPHELRPLLQAIKENNSYLFIDESFIDFTEKSSVINLIDEYPIFILRSMTKTYGIPGLRLGYGLGNTEIIQKLNDIKEPWTINSLALKAVETLIEDEDYYNQTKKWYKSEKEFLLKQLSLINDIKIFSSEGNFFLCKLKNTTGKDLKKNLLDRGIYIRTCADFEGLDDSFVRFAVRSRNENEKLIHSLIENFKEE